MRFKVFFRKKYNYLSDNPAFDSFKFHDFAGSEKITLFKSQTKRIV